MCYTLSGTLLGLVIFKVSCLCFLFLQWHQRPRFRLYPPRGLTSCRTEHGSASCDILCLHISLLKSMGKALVKIIKIHKFVSGPQLPFLSGFCFPHGATSSSGLQGPSYGALLAVHYIQHLSVNKYLFSTYQYTQDYYFFKDAISILSVYKVWTWAAHQKTTCPTSGNLLKSFPTLTLGLAGWLPQPIRY